MNTHPHSSCPKLSLLDAINRRSAVANLSLILFASGLNAAAAPPSQSFDVSPGENVIILSASWEKESAKLPNLRLLGPDGTVVEESAFLRGAAAQDHTNARSGAVAVLEKLSNSLSRTLMVYKPTPGIWTLGITEPDPSLGKVAFTAIPATSQSPDPVIEWMQPLTDTTSGGRVEIAWRSRSGDADLTFQLGYDDDTLNFDGIPISGIRRDGEIFRATWDTSQVKGGRYHLYLSAMEVGRSGIVKSYAPGAVKIPHRASLRLEVTAPPSNVKPGQSIALIAQIINTGSKASGPLEVELRVPPFAKVTEINPWPVRVSADSRVIRIPSVKPQSFANVQLGLEVPSKDTALPLELRIHAAEGEWSQDAPSSWAHTVNVSAQRFVDLQVKRSALSGRVFVGREVDYVVTVVNGGTQPASNVILREWVGNARIVSASPSQGSAKLDLSDTSRAEIFLDKLAPGAKAEVKVRLQLSAWGRQVTTSSVEATEVDAAPLDNEKISEDRVETAADLPPQDLPAASSNDVVPFRTPSGNARVPTLLVDGSFEDGGKGWGQTSWRPKPATIVRESRNSFVRIEVPEGRGDEFFAPVDLPPGCSAVKVRFRVRCQINEDSALPAFMVMFGSAEKRAGKPIKVNPAHEWEWHEVVVHFRANPKNDRLEITSVASPFAADFDDISLSLPTTEEAEPPVSRDGPKN